MMTESSRVGQMDDRSDIAATAIEILTLPASRTRCQAIATIGGMGEQYRVAHPIERWEHDSEATHLLIGGLALAEKYYEPMTIEHLSKPPYNLQRTENVHTQESALHTADQTDWIVDKAIELGISSFLFFAPSYHIVRAYLTLLKSWIKTGADLIVMLPQPLCRPQTIILLESGISGRAMIPGEIERIFRYRAKGDVATLLELREYIDLISTIIYP